MEDMRKRIAMLMDSRQWRDRYFKMVKEALQDPEVQAFLKQHTGELAMMRLIAEPRRSTNLSANETKLLAANYHWHRGISRP